MAPVTVQSWVDGIQQLVQSRMSHRKNGSAASGRDREEKDCEAPKGNDYSFEESRQTEKTEEKRSMEPGREDPWNSLAVDETARDKSRISNLTEAAWEPDLTPERLRPSKSDISQLTRDLDRVEPATYQPKRGESTRLRPLQEDYWLCRDYKSHRSQSADSESSSEHEDRPRPSSMPACSPARNTLRNTFSRILSLQPSDVPYPISWLISAYSSQSRHSVSQSEPAISKLYTGPQDGAANQSGQAEVEVEYIKQPGQIRIPTDAFQAHFNRNTLSPEDSISICSPKQSEELHIPDLPERQPKMSHRITHVASDSLSYCPSQSTHAYIYERPDAVVTMKRVATPPLVNASVVRGLQDSPLSPIQDSPLGTRQSNLFPPFASPPPIYDPGMGPIRSIPVEKLPPGYQPEPRNARIAWLHAITGLLIVFNCWGLNNAFGLFQEYYETTYLPGTSPSTVAWIGSTQLALVFALGVPVGRLVDRGYFRLVFHSGTIIMLTGIFCTAWCTRFWQLLLVQGLITGFGMGMVFCSGTVALLTWFDETHVGMAMGIAAAGSAIGGVAYVLLTRYFLSSLGFATTMRILGGVATVAMIPPTLVYRMRDQKHKDLRKIQRGSRAPSRARFGSFGSSTMLPLPITTPMTPPAWRAFVEPSYLLAGAGMFLAFLGVYFGFVYIVSYGRTYLHLSSEASTNLLIFMLAANLPGRFVPALISDRCIGPLNTIIPSVLLSSAVIGLWAASQQTEVSLIVVACFYGFVSAGVQVLYAPTVHAFCMEPKPTRAPSRASTPALDEMSMGHRLATDRLGIKAGGIFTFIGIACLVGTPISGALIKYRTDRGLPQPFLGAQIFAGVSLLLSGVFLLASRVAKAGWTARRA